MHLTIYAHTPVKARYQRFFGFVQIIAE